MTDSPAAEPCGAHPRHGSARCDLPAGHPGDHCAPLAIGGRITYPPHLWDWERTHRHA